jgi:hypothetical protein
VGQSDELIWLSVNCVDRVKRKIITSSANQHPKNRLTAEDRGPQGAGKVGRVDIGEDSMHRILGKDVQVV